MAPTTVLIADHDLGFVFWLGHALDSLGYSALPAKTVPDAALLIMQLDLQVDVLLINLELEGAGDFVLALHRRYPLLKVIGIIQDSLQSPAIPGITTIQKKPVAIDSQAKIGWIHCIEGLMAKTVAQTSCQ